MTSPLLTKGLVMQMNPSQLTKYLKRIIGLVYADKSNQGGRYYHELMYYLYSREFYWSEDIPMDRNRALDGIALREKYGYPGDVMDEPCSVLEMLIALACRIENQLMHNFDEGDRTAQWFWIMATNLGLNRLDDDNFDLDTADFFVDRFLNREYNYNGEGGGLFVVENPRQDMRDVEIWYQVNWYLTEMDGYL